jgi:hypothetical protein
MGIRKTVCERFSLCPQTPHLDSVIGLAIASVGKGEINGLRHPIQGNSNGWYIWYGEYSNSDDFFSPVCIKHLNKYFNKDINEYLDLPIGFRFLIANNYEDVWYDEKLLII